MARALTNTEIAELLATHPDLALRVGEFKAMVLAGLWNPTSYIGYQSNVVPIPTYGLTIDTSDGPVIVFPAADGTLYYTLAQSANEISSANEIKKPLPSDPDGSLYGILSGMASDAADVGKGLYGILQLLVIGGALWFAYDLYKKHA